MELEEPRLTLRHERHRCHRLTLGPRRKDTDLAGIEALDVLDVLEQVALRNGQDAKLSSQLHVVTHRSSERGDLAIVGDGGIDDLLDAVEVAGEAGHDDPLTLTHGEDSTQGLADRRLLCGEPRLLGFG